MSQARLLGFVTVGVKSVLPISMESAFRSLGRSSSFRLVAPEAQSMTSSNLPGKVPNMMTTRLTRVGTVWRC